jgi:hypothetical protein
MRMNAVVNFLRVQSCSSAILYLLALAQGNLSAIFSAPKIELNGNKIYLFLSRHLHNDLIQ